MSRRDGWDGVPFRHFRIPRGRSEEGADVVLEKPSLPQEPIVNLLTACDARVALLNAKC
jgi:hypothetical protein